ncbi:uncharacterized protein CIMG_13272 [Coccidioides immitis RS]|uniref:Uncharacterized protein n=1 Tax=Coccidioides immitis (strain RS) TaxID=246410 RepID=A0A0D8JUN2_COCIM|nr:uncharacterized protein CIMG_13272 [Coccidioides immitis RS]KJF60844.1 hypothetical protein CIMG_13272 [Coccidioides immitis RS]
MKGSTGARMHAAVPRLSLLTTCGCTSDKEDNLKTCLVLGILHVCFRGDQSQVNLLLSTQKLLFQVAELQFTPEKHASLLLFVEIKVKKREKVPAKVAVFWSYKVAPSNRKFLRHWGRIITRSVTVSTLFSGIAGKVARVRKKYP